MVSGKGGLNIKDYPFAFSIVALAFPSLLSPENTQNANPYYPILAIALFGAMIGSILTIVNPIGLVIRIAYINMKIKGKILKTATNDFVDSIIEKNFRASLSTPSISYETDKIVGVIYFGIILGFAFYRIEFSDLASNLGLDAFGKSIASVLIFSFILGVILKIAIEISGFTGMKYRSISHLGRIKIVTLFNTTKDFINLSTAGQKIQDSYLTSYSEVAHTMCNEFSKYNSHSFSNENEFKNNFNIVNIQQRYIDTTRQSLNKDVMLHRYWNLYQIIKEISESYHQEFNKLLVWFYPLHFTPPQVELSDLYSSIQARDWHTANLNYIGLQQTLETFLEQKGMPQELPQN